MTPEEVLAGIVARRKAPPPSSNSLPSTRAHETTAPAENSGRFLAKGAEPAEPSLKRDGVDGQNAPAVETLPAGPFTAVCAWLSSLHLAPHHGQNTGTGNAVNTPSTRGITPAKHPEKHPGPEAAEHPVKHPEPEVPPYVLRLVSLLERIGDGTADDSDRQRLRSWLPNGIFNARLVHRRDPAAGAELLAELGVVP